MQRGCSPIVWPTCTSARSLIALAFGLSNLLLRSTAWSNILAAAHPGVKVRWRSITGAYLAGAGVNAVVPARGGDVTKIYLAHRSIPGSAYTTVTSSLIAETPSTS